jgi:hypothetical protein
MGPSGQSHGAVVCGVALCRHGSALPTGVCRHTPWLVYLLRSFGYAIHCRDSGAEAPTTGVD